MTEGSEAPYEFVCCGPEFWFWEFNIFGNNAPGFVNLVCLSMHRCICVEKIRQLDATEWFNALIICSTCFGHFYAHHQEHETICVLLPPMVCNALVAGCRRSDAGQQAMRSG